jgi:exopolysaccharide production protein ExoQ
MTMETAQFGRFSGHMPDIAAAARPSALAALAVEPIVGTLAALAFLMRGWSPSGAAPGRGDARPLAFRWLMLLPLFCLVSVLWSDAPGASAAGGLQLFLTCVIAILVARRLPPGRFLIVADGRSGRHRRAKHRDGILPVRYRRVDGLFRQQERHGHGGRASGSGGGGAGGPGGAGVPGGPGRLGVVARGGGSRAGAIHGRAGGDGHRAVHLSRPRGPAPVEPAPAGRGLGRLRLAGWVPDRSADRQYRRRSAAMILSATGKDITLTGRTDLWRVPRWMRSPNRPWLGHGYQAFWRIGNPEAEHLWRAFGIESRSGFHFHNLYLSNAVEIGMIGAGIQAMLLASLGRLTLRLALVSTDHRAATHPGDDGHGAVDHAAGSAGVLSLSTCRPSCWWRAWSTRGTGWRPGGSRRRSGAAAAGAELIPSRGSRGRARRACRAGRRGRWA